MTFNNNRVQTALDVMTNWGSPFEHRDSLINVASGIEATDEVSSDLLAAVQKGEKSMHEFIEDRIKTSKTSFYAPIKRMSLKSFGDLKKKKTIKLKEKTITLAAERSLFGRLLAIASNGKGLSLKETLQYSLSPIPWALGLPDGTIVKTIKSKLLGKKIFCIFTYQ